MMNYMTPVTERTYSRAVWGFSFYDFANSAYILVFNAFLLPIYFREVVFLNDSRADWYWGLTISCSLLIALVVSPFVGDWADRGRRRGVFTLLVIGVCAGLTALLSLPSSATLAFTFVFGLTNVLYVVSLCVYDSFLSFVSRPADRSLISGFAWGFGYLGGILCLSTIYLLQDGLRATKAALIITAVFFGLFSLLSIRWLPDPGPTARRDGNVTTRLLSLVRGRILWLLVAFLFVNEGIDVVIYFTSLFARVTLGLGTETIGGYLILVQLLAFPGTWFMGWLAHRWSERPILLITFGVWSMLIIGTALSQTPVHFFSLAAGLALVLGSSQALMRSFFTRQFSPEVAGLSFGLYSLVSRATSLFGPAIFGGVSAWTGSQRAAMWAVLPFFAIGAVMFAFVRDGSFRLSDAE